jgi:hypothetical protein
VQGSLILVGLAESLTNIIRVVSKKSLGTTYSDKVGVKSISAVFRLATACSGSSPAINVLTSR